MTVWWKSIFGAFERRTDAPDEEVDITDLSGELRKKTLLIDRALEVDQVNGFIKHLIDSKKGLGFLFLAGKGRHAHVEFMERLSLPREIQLGKQYDSEWQVVSIYDAIQRPIHVVKKRTLSDLLICDRILNELDFLTRRDLNDLSDFISSVDVDSSKKVLIFPVALSESMLRTDLLIKHIQEILDCSERLRGKDRNAWESLRKRARFVFVYYLENCESGDFGIASDNQETTEFNPEIALCGARAKPVETKNDQNMWAISDWRPATKLDVEGWLNDVRVTFDPHIEERIDALGLEDKLRALFGSAEATNGVELEIVIETASRILKQAAHAATQAK